MKILSTVLFLTLMILNSSFAATVKGARIEGDKLLIDVTHGGGCGEHLYDLQVGSCMETFPVQCTAELIHETNDFCEAMLFRTVEISLEAKGLKGEYFQNGSLTIFGDKDWATGKRSQATVILK